MLRSGEWHIDTARVSVFGRSRISEAGVEDGGLVAELLRRTEANKARNDAIVKATTEANAFTAIDGSVGKRLVTDLSGRNRYLDAAEVRELTRQRRLACAPSVMEPCRYATTAMRTARNRSPCAVDECVLCL
jgi:hypothetical protein